MGSTPSSGTKTLSENPQQTTVPFDCGVCTIVQALRGALLWGFMSATISAPRQTRARRRSKRLRLTVPVEIIAFEGETELFRESTQMHSVNAPGGLIVMAAPVTVGQVLRLVNRSTQEQQECRVVNLETTESNKWAAGIEFVQPAAAGNFWQISFPPLNGCN